MPPRKKRRPSAGGGRKTSRMKAGTAKRVSEDEVAINLTGVEGRTRRRTRIPEGNYRAKVVEAKASQAKSGNDMITWMFEIVDDEKQSGQRFWHRTVLTDAALWNLRATVEALGEKVKDGTMSLKLGRFAGRTCGIEIIDGEYEGKVVSEINDVFPEALLDEEDDEEEPDEERDEEEYDEEDESEEDEESDEGEDEEYEEELDEDEVKAMGIKELRQLARDYDLDPTGLKKAEIIEALLSDEDEEEADDWEDEVDLEDEDL